ncbi:MAG: SDR family oxidoreductase [Chromatiales bacterium]|jgi:NAD(P)-dependent dehydrogenase (short-subunit alcohol dehydrogenase family)|nr:SDR family oxidoreductase [Chromatiales bacterium]
MEIAGKRVVITGGASGIGKAMARRFKAQGAAGIVVADLQAEPLQAVADEVGGLAVPTNVASEPEIQALVTAAEVHMGHIDIFCSNAGVAMLGDEFVPNADWQKNWDIHVMAHVYAARAVAPGMAERGSGYLVNTASAAGLLSHVHSATYAVTKHAAVALAEWLSITYGHQGVRVSVLCPQAVRTPMTQGREGGVASTDGMIEPEELADCVVETMAREAFLILPHEEVLKYMQRKTNDYDRWLSGMSRQKQRFPAGSV